MLSFVVATVVHALSGDNGHRAAFNKFSHTSLANIVSSW
jgi:hypothetical protein